MSYNRGYFAPSHRLAAQKQMLDFDPLLYQENKELYSKATMRAFMSTLNGFYFPEKQFESYFKKQYKDRSYSDVHKEIYNAFSLRQGGGSGKTLKQRVNYNILYGDEDLSTSEQSEVKRLGSIYKSGLRGDGTLGEKDKERYEKQLKKASYVVQHRMDLKERLLRFEDRLEIPLEKFVGIRNRGWDINADPERPPMHKRHFPKASFPTEEDRKTYEFFSMGDSKLEKRAKTGEITGTWDHFQVGVYNTWRKMGLGVDSMEWGETSEKHCRLLYNELSDMEKWTSRTLPEGEGFFDTMVYGTLQSLPFVASAFIPKGIGMIAYGTGEFLYERYKQTGKTPSDYGSAGEAGLKVFALTIGAAFAQIEKMGRFMGMQGWGKGFASKIADKVLKKYGAKKAFGMVVARGTEAIIDLALEMTEEGLQAVLMDSGLKLSQGERISITNQIKLGTRETFRSFPAVTGLMVTGGGVNVVTTKAGEHKLKKNLVKSGIPATKAQDLAKRMIRANDPELQKEIKAEALGVSINMQVKMGVIAKILGGKGSMYPRIGVLTQEEAKALGEIYTDKELDEKFEDNEALRAFKKAIRTGDVDDFNKIAAGQTMTKEDKNELDSLGKGLSIESIVAHDENADNSPYKDLSELELAKIVAGNLGLQPYLHDALKKEIYRRFGKDIDGFRRLVLDLRKEAVESPTLEEKTRQRAKSRFTIVSDHAEQLQQEVMEKFDKVIKGLVYYLANKKKQSWVNANDRGVEIEGKLHEAVMQGDEELMLTKLKELGIRTDGFFAGRMRYIIKEVNRVKEIIRQEQAQQKPVKAPESGVKAPKGRKQGSRPTQAPAPAKTVVAKTGEAITVEEVVEALRAAGFTEEQIQSIPEKSLKFLSENNFNVLAKSGTLYGLTINDKVDVPLSSLTQEELDLVEKGATERVASGRNTPEAAQKFLEDAFLLKEIKKEQARRATPTPQAPSKVQEEQAKYGPDADNPLMEGDRAEQEEEQEIKEREVLKILDADPSNLEYYNTLPSSWVRLSGGHYIVSIGTYIDGGAGFEGVRLKDTELEVKLIERSDGRKAALIPRSELQYTVGFTGGIPEEVNTSGADTDEQIEAAIQEQVKRGETLPTQEAEPRSPDEIVVVPLEKTDTVKSENLIPYDDSLLADAHKFLAGELSVEELIVDLQARIDRAGTMEAKQAVLDKWKAENPEAVAEIEKNVLYHGTPAKFALQDIKEGFGKEFVSRGIMFTDNKDVARKHSGAGEYEIIHKGVINLKNPLVVDAKGAHWLEIRFEGQKIDIDDLAGVARSRGNDGVLVKNVQDVRGITGNTTIALEPSQIKPAPLTLNSKGVLQGFREASEALKQSRVQKEQSEHGQEAPEATEQKEPPERNSEEEIRQTAESLAWDFYNRLSLDGVDNERLIRYLAARQKYGGVGDDPKELFKTLEQSEKELVEQWDRLANEIRERLEAISEKLGFDFKAIAHDFFPMYHEIMSREESDSEASLLKEAFGVYAHRSGTAGFEGVIKDVDRQVKRYLWGASKLITLGERLALAEKELPLVEITRAMAKLDNDEELKENDKDALRKLEEYRKLSEQGEAKGITRSYFTETEFYRTANQLIDSEDIEGWDKGYDPFHAVLQMDGADARKRDEDGNMFGVNTRLWHGVVLEIVNEYNSLNQAERIWQQENVLKYFRKFRNKLKLRALDKKLHKIFIQTERRDLVKYIKSSIEMKERYDLTDEELEVVKKYYHRLLQLGKLRKKFGDVRSDLEIIRSEQYKEFALLEKKVDKKTATEEEIKKYHKWSSKHGNLAGRGMRGLARWVFERDAMDKKSFFAAYNSIAQKTFKSAMYAPAVEKINRIAQFYREIGKVKNAEWWEIRANNHLIGNMFSLENEMLDAAVAVLTKGDTSLSKKTIKKLIKELKKDQEREFGGGGENALDESDPHVTMIKALTTLSPDQAKLLLVDAMNHLHRSRINAFLALNFAWVMFTQPASYLITMAKTGKYAFTAFGGGDVDDTESLVLGIKSKAAKKLSGIAAMGDFEDAAVRPRFRQAARNWGAAVPSLLEHKLTSLSYIAGYMKAKEKLNLTDKEARIYGDYIAATTQTMYNKECRNSWLNSNIIRSILFFQSFAFTQYSNLAEVRGKTGLQSSQITKAKAVITFVVGAIMWDFLSSLLMGDEPEKALLDPAINRNTPGSFIPLAGDWFDDAIRAAFPWQKSNVYGRNNFKDMALHLYRVVGGLVEGKENADAELKIFTTRYITPFMGIPGSRMMENLIDWNVAQDSYYRYEDIRGYTTGEVEGFLWANERDMLTGIAATVFGEKAVVDDNELGD